MNFQRHYPTLSTQVTIYQLWVWAGCVLFITYSAACSSLQITDITKADGGGGGGPPPAYCINLLTENKQQGFQQGNFTARNHKC